MKVSDTLRNTTVTKADFCLEIEDLKAEDPVQMCDATRSFFSMQYSLIMNIIVLFIGAVCFFIIAIFIIVDKEQVELYIAGKPSYYSLAEVLSLLTFLANRVITVKPANSTISADLAITELN